MLHAFVCGFIGHLYLFFLIKSTPVLSEVPCLFIKLQECLGNRSCVLNGNIICGFLIHFLTGIFS